MNISKMIRKGLMAGLILGGAQFAQAGIISFEPNPAFGTPGGSVFVDMIWTAEGDYIGAFDVDVNYDAAIVEVAGVTVDPDLGLDSFGLGLYGDGVPSAGGGTYSIFGISFDAPGDLMFNQDLLGNTFVLATIEFLGLANGISDVSLGFQLFGDENGDPLRPMTVNDGQICISDTGDRCPEPPVGVPEPAPFALLLLGLGLLGLRRLA